MDALGLSNTAQRGDDYYREQWHLYYTEKHRLLTRIFWLAGGGAVTFLIFTEVVTPHPHLANILAIPLAILLLALPAQWFVFAWKIGGVELPEMCRTFLRLDLCQESVGTELSPLRTSSTKRVGNRSSS